MSSEKLIDQAIYYDYLYYVYMYYIYYCRRVRGPNSITLTSKYICKTNQMYYTILCVIILLYVLLPNLLISTLL